MKTATTLILVISIVLFIGCGGGGSSSSIESSTPDNDLVSVTSSYNYNSDGSAARTLNNDYVNTYESIEQKLNTLKNNKTAFTQELDIFITQMLQNATSDDKLPSFAPRGNSKSLNVEVKDSKIDYSAYKLIGDINLDNSVDFSDIDELKNALFSQSQASMYDVNSDANVNVKDIIELAARLNTHIAFFDFYTTLGEKLDIATRAVSDVKIITYTGGETSIMVVAKDENMASSFENTLSDLADVWYKKSGWVYQSTSEITQQRASKVSMVTEAIDEALNITPSPYLLGWHFSVDYLETGYFSELDELGLFGMEFYLNKAKDQIDQYFRKADMDHPAKTHLSKTHYLYHIGSTNGEQNEVSGSRKSFKHSFKLDGQQVLIRQYAGAFSVLYESTADKTLSGKVTKEPKLNGKITLKRVGPHNEGDFEGTIKDNDIDVKNLPYGEFSSEIEDACTCTYTGKNFVFDAGKSSLSLDIDNAKADVELLIVDTSDKPLKDKEVELKAKECISDAKSIGKKRSDSSGKVLFSSINIGDYEVFVDGKKAKDIHFCENHNDTIVLNPLWKFHTTFSSSFPGGGSMTIKKFPIDIDKINDHSYSAFIVFVGNDYQSYPEGTTISYSGLAYDDGLSPLLVSADGVDWAALKVIPNNPPIIYQIGSISGTSGAVSGLDCPGALPSSFESKVKAGEPISWTSAGYENSCTFLFEPCQNEECN